MTDQDLPPTFEAAVDSYRLKLVRDPHCPLDAFFPPAHETQNHLGTTVRTCDRSQLLRLLLQEERGASDRNRFDFRSYWSRPWFKDHVDDVVAVLLEDRFEIVRLLGAGGQGLVYLVKNLKVDGRLEALKVFHLKDHQQLTEAEFKEWQARFRRESAATHKLCGNEHVPMVYEVNEIHGIYYFTMAYIEGETLKDHVERSKEPIRPRQAAVWMHTLAGALHTLHSSGHIHRDVKPSNLMLDKSGFLYLLDFGLVKIQSEGQHELTRLGGFGTRGYLAPEQETDARSVTPKADVFSLGATFYFTLTGRSWDETKGKAAWPKSIPSPLRDLCEACLDVDPNKRPTAREVERRLSHWLHRLSRRQWLGISAAALLSVGGGLWYKFRPVPLSGIVENAANLRKIYLDNLFEEQRWEQGVLLYRNSEPLDPAWPEVGTLAQSAYAVLSALPHLGSAEAHATGIDRLLANLSYPFEKKNETYWIIRKDAANRLLGWISGSKQNCLTVERTLWMTIACARAIRWCNDNPNQNARLDKLKSHHRQLLSMLQAFYWAPTGGWNFYANQKEPLKHSSYAAALALLAILESQNAGLDWFAAAAIGKEPKLWLNHTRSFLFDAHQRDKGWRCRLHRQAADDSLQSPGDRELDLLIRASLLRTAVAHPELMPEDRIRFKSDCLALLAHEEFSQGGKLAKEQSVKLEAKLTIGIADDAEPKLDAEESMTVFFYPWVLTLASLLLRMAPEFQLTFSERHQLHRRLSDWVVPLGEELRHQRYNKSCKTYYLAEAILGLTAVAELKQ